VQAKIDELSVLDDYKYANGDRNGYKVPEGVKFKVKELQDEGKELRKEINRLRHDGSTQALAGTKMRIKDIV
jgi:hypothetical protein